MAIKKACIIGNSIKNTGKECDAAMGPTAMLIAVPPSTLITLEDLEDPTEWIRPLLHAPKASRVYPFFGNVAPINTINNNAEGDTTVTMDDGTIVFLRYGIYNRLFETTSGGLCYARALAGLNKSGYRILELDQDGQILLHKNSTKGEFSGLITSFMYAPSPVLADFTTTPYKNRFQVSYSPTEMVKFGEVFSGADELLSLMGLIDSEIVDKGSHTTTLIRVGVATECAEEDLVTKFPLLGTFPDNFKVTNVATGTVVTPSGASVVADGVVGLVGVYVAGQVYRVSGGPAATWLANGIEGYDAEDHSVLVTIPG